MSVERNLAKRIAGIAPCDTGWIDPIRFVMRIRERARELSAGGECGAREALTSLVCSIVVSRETKTSERLAAIARLQSLLALSSPDTPTIRMPALSLNGAETLSYDKSALAAPVEARAEPVDGAEDA